MLKTFPPTSYVKSIVLFSVRKRKVAQRRVLIVAVLHNISVKGAIEGKNMVNRSHL